MQRTTSDSINSGGNHLEHKATTKEMNKKTPANIYHTFKIFSYLPNTKNNTTTERYSFEKNVDFLWFSFGAFFVNSQYVFSTI